MANKMSIQKFDVVGMHCASCANIIKKKLTKVVGVESANVNFATETAEITTTQVPTKPESDFPSVTLKSVIRAKSEI